MVKPRRKQPPKENPAFRNARIAIVIGVVVASILGLRLFLQGVHADHTSTVAWKASRDPAKKEMSIQGFRRALEIAQWDPVNQFRLGNAILETESGRYKRRGVEAVRGENLKEALDLFRESDKARMKPHFVSLRQAQTALFISEIAQETGNAEEAADYAELASDFFYGFEQEWGYPEIDPEIYLKQSVASAMRAARFNTVIDAYEDHVVKYGLEEIRNPALRYQVVDARRLMGDYPAMMVDLQRLLEENPGDGQAQKALGRALVLAKQQYATFLILDSLAKEGRLPDGARKLHEELAKVFASASE